MRWSRLLPWGRWRVVRRCRALILAIRLRPLHLSGKNVVLSTAAGVRGLHLFRGAPRLFAASLVCARATAKAIRAGGGGHVCFVVTGEWADRDGDEDVACADYLQALLGGDSPGPEAFAQRVRQSDFGKRFALGTWPDLPTADLDLVAQADLFGFAMPVHREAERLVIRAQIPEPRPDR